MMGLRTAVVVLAGCICAPSLTAAQPHPQLDVLTGIIQSCTDASVFPADWPEVLSDWDAKTPPPERITDAYLSNGVLAGYAEDGLLSPSMSPLERVAFLAEFQSDFDWDKQYEAEHPEDVPEIFFEHSSGWIFALDISDDDPASTFCVIWHMDPEEAVIDYLTAPYLGFEPLDTDVGTFSTVRLILPDTPPDLASLRISVLTVDPSVNVPSSVLAQHPIRFHPPVAVEIFYTAHSRDPD